MGAGPVLPAVFVIETADGETGFGRNISTQAVRVPGGRLDEGKCPEPTPGLGGGGQVLYCQFLRWYKT